MKPGESYLIFPSSLGVGSENKTRTVPYAQVYPVYEQECIRTGD